SMQNTIMTYALATECAKKICPEVEMASFYCTSIMVSDKYFTNEVRRAPQLITNAWLKKAENGAREVAQMKAFYCPKTFIERSQVLAVHYRPWTTIKLIIEKVKSVLDTIVTIERLRKSHLRKVS